MPRALRHSWRRRNISRSPARTLPTARNGREGRRGAAKGGGIVRVNFARPAAFVAAPTTANDAEDNDAANGTGQADHERFVIVDPALNFFGDRGATTHSVGACAAPSAGSAIQEVLLQTIASVAREFRTGTAHHAVGVIARVCVVALRVAAHDCLALLVAGGALSAGTLQPIPAVLTIRLRLVLRAIRRVTGASLLGVAGAGARTTNSLSRGELAVLATVLIGVVADGVTDEFTGLGIATAVASTARRAAAVALLITFDDAVAASLARNSGNTAVVG